MVRRARARAVVLAALAKPNLVAPLIPAIVVIAWLDLDRPRSLAALWADRVGRTTILTVVLPAIGTTIVQLLVATYQIDPRYRGGWRWHAARAEVPRDPRPGRR